MSQLVSIVTPCYNGARFIASTIESVLAQSYQNWEMIVVDDCSTDGSDEIIIHYANADPRISYYRTVMPSGGPSKPRNIGIDNAHGDYIAFLDADDHWLPEKLATQMAFIEANSCELAYSYYEKMDYDGKRNNRVVRTREQTRYSDLLKSNSIPCLTAVVSRQAVGDTRFKSIAQEDFCFWLDILKKGGTARNCCQVTAIYRETTHSRSANKLAMFRGYWHVIRHYQQIPILACCFYMLTYTVIGVIKYLK